MANGIKKGKKRVLIHSFILILVAVGIGFLFVPLFKSFQLGLDLKGGYEILYKVESNDGSNVDKATLKDTYTALSKRMEHLGISDPELLIEGKDKIRVRFASTKDPEEIRSQLSTIATLSFRDSEDNLLMTSEVLNEGKTRVTQDQEGNPAVALSIKDQDQFYEVTDRISKRENNLIVIWLDYNQMTDSYEKEGSLCGKSGSNCLSAARVSQGFQGDVVIQGDFTLEEVQNLVNLINSGPLPSTITEVSFTKVDASLGKQALQTTLTTALVFAAIVVVAFILLYHFSGFLASIAMVVYSFLAFSIFWMLGKILTFSEIVAFLLGIYMIIDFLIITLGRIQEELLKGKSLENAYKEGVKQSIRIVVDSNVLIFIIAILMFIFGKFSMRGFATMLMITVLVAMIIILLMKYLLKLFIYTDYFNHKTNLFICVKEENIPDVKKNEESKPNKYYKVQFFKHPNIAFILPCIIVVIGAIMIGVKGLPLGTDYKNGTSITITTEQALTEKEVKKDLKELGYKAYRIEKTDDEVNIVLKNTVDKEKVKSYFEEKYEAKVTIGSVSNLLQKDLLKNIIIFVVVSFIIIMIYLSKRYNSHYALGVVLALIYNLLIVFSLFVIFRFEINFVFILALFAVMGYSIHNTIVCLARVRENLVLSSHEKLTRDRFTEICNCSFQETFARTIRMIVLALIPVIILFILGFKGIFNFAMLFGLLAGTYSSIFVAAVIFMATQKKNLR